MEASGEREAREEKLEACGIYTVFVCENQIFGVVHCLFVQAGVAVRAR